MIKTSLEFKKLKYEELKDNIKQKPENKDYIIEKAIIDLGKKNYINAIDYILQKFYKNKIDRLFVIESICLQCLEMHNTQLIRNLSVRLKPSSLNRILKIIYYSYNDELILLLMILIVNKYKYFELNSNTINYLFASFKFDSLFYAIKNGFANVDDITYYTIVEVDKNFQANENFKKSSDVFKKLLKYGFNIEKACEKLKYSEARKLKTIFQKS